MKSIALILIAVVLAAGCGGESKTQKTHDHLQAFAKSQCQLLNTINGTHKPC